MNVERVQHHVALTGNGPFFILAPFGGKHRFVHVEGLAVDHVAVAEIERFGFALRAAVIHPGHLAMIHALHIAVVHALHAALLHAFHVSSARRAMIHALPAIA